MHIGKLGGAVATLALVSVFVFGGVDVAHAAAPVTLTAFNSSGTTSASLAATNSIGGTAEPGVTISVSMTNSATTAPYCTAVVDPLGYWSCPSGATVPLGSTTFAATDGATTATSAAIMVYGGDSPSLTNPQSGVNVVPVAPVFSGYGPARGSITVLANTGGPICTVASIPDTGTWDCYSTATLVQGSNGFTVMASTPGYPSDTYFSSTSATVPVTVSQLKPPVINYTVGYATVTSAASIAFQNGAVGTDLYSITEPSGEGNGYVRSPSTSPSCGPSAGPNALVCNFAALAPGIWESSSYQYVGELAPAYRNDFFRIPTAPSLTATAQPDQTVSFSGTGTTGDLVSVTATGGSDGGTVACNATVVAGAWSCATPATPGNHSYHASQLDQGWTPYLDSDGSGNVAGAPLGSVLDGRSALTQTASVTVLAPPTPPVTPAPPVMNYDFGNASVTITATGDPTGDGSSLDVYALADGGSSYLSTAYPECVSAHGNYLGGTPISTTQTCTLNALTPGIWNISSAQSVNGAQSAFHSDLFRVPDAPTIQARFDSTSTVILSGTGTTGDIVTALQDGASACQATVVAGTWTCTISSDSVSHNYTASQLDQGFVPTYSGYSASTVYDARSALSPSVALAAVVPPNSTPPAPPIPTPSPTPSPSPSPSPSAPPLPTATSPTSNIQTLFYWVLSIDGDGGPLHAGDSVTVSSSGLPVGALVTFELHSTPRALGSMTVGVDGAFSQTLTIPQDVEPGDHHIVVTVTPAGEAPSPQQAAITVVSAPPTTATATSDAASSEATTPGKIHQRGASGAVNRDTPSAPSAFTNALPTFANLMDNPGALVGAVGLALAIMLLVAIPTELLNSTITSNMDRFGSFFSRAEGAIERAGGWLTRVTKTRATASAVLIVISSIIFGFADPHYGFDLVSLRLTLSLALAMFIVYYIASFISGRIAKARWGVESEISMQPIALIFAIVGVVLGRVLGFSPGFLIGLALGLELASNAPSAHRAKTLILRTSVVVGLALVAWAGYSLMQLWMAGGTETFWSTLAQDTLVSVTAEGLTGMVLALLPLSFMEGKELWDYSKLLWTGLFLFTAAAFSILVLPTAIEGEALGGSLTVWLLVLGCFTAGTLALWTYLRFSRKKTFDGDTSTTANQAKVDA